MNLLIELGGIKAIIWGALSVLGKYINIKLFMTYMISELQFMKLEDQST